jgi:hypothetical protein
VIERIGGFYRLDARVVLRNFVGGSVSRAQGFGFLAGVANSYRLDWRQRSEYEQRFPDVGSGSGPGAMRPAREPDPGTDGLDVRR